MINEFIVFSDIQYYNNQSKSYLTSDGSTSWFTAQLGVTEQILNYAINNKIHIVAHNGDLFEEKNRIETSLYTDVWELYNYYHKKYELRFIFNRGNHDGLALSDKSSLKPFSSFSTVISNVSDIGYWRFIPYGKVTKESLESHRVCDILFLHEDIQGLSYGTQTFRSRSNLKLDMLSSWKFVFNGHIHKPQRIGNLYVIGSPMIQDWGEAEDKKGFIHYKEDKIKFVETDYPKFYYIDKLTKPNIAMMEENKRDFFKVSIEQSEASHYIFKQYNVVPNLIQNEIVSERMQLFEDKSDIEEVEAYIDLYCADLDKQKLLEIAKGLIE